MRMLAFLLLVPGFICCSSSSPETSPPGPKNSTPPGLVAFPGLLDDMSNHIGFARVGGSSFAAFDLETGASIAEARLDGAVIDLEWDGVHSRLLVVSLIGEGEQSNVSAFELRGGDWKHVASSQEFSTATYVIASHGTVVVMSEDMGVSWSLLGPELEPLGMPKVLGRPSGIAPLSSTELVALDPNGGDANGYEDLLRRVRLEPMSEVERVGFPAMGRPASRWALVEPGRVAAVVRKHESKPAFEVGGVELGALLEAPSFTFRDVPDATGALAAVSYDPARNELIALLSEGNGPGRIARFGVHAETPTTVIGLGAPVETSPWPNRQLAFHAASDTLLVATTSGVRAFRGTRERKEFAGSRYAAPLVIMSPGG